MKGKGGKIMHIAYVLNTFLKPKSFIYKLD